MVGPRRRTRRHPRAASDSASDRRASWRKTRAAAPGAESPSSTGACTHAATTGPPRATAASSAGLSERRKSRRNQTTVAGGILSIGIGHLPEGVGSTPEAFASIPDRLLESPGSATESAGGQEGNRVEGPGPELREFVDQVPALPDGIDGRAARRRRGPDRRARALRGPGSRGRVRAGDVRPLGFGSDRGPGRPVRHRAPGRPRRGAVPGAGPGGRRGPRCDPGDDPLRPAAQPRQPPGDRGRPRDVPGGAAGGGLRHRLPPDDASPRLPLRPPPRSVRRPSRAALRLPRDLARPRRPARRRTPRQAAGVPEPDHPPPRERRERRRDPGGEERRHVDGDDPAGGTDHGDPLRRPGPRGPLLPRGGDGEGSRGDPGPAERGERAERDLRGERHAGSAPDGRGGGSVRDACDRHVQLPDQEIHRRLHRRPRPGRRAGVHRGDRRERRRGAAAGVRGACAARDRRRRSEETDLHPGSPGRSSGKGCRSRSSSSRRTRSSRSPCRPSRASGKTSGRRNRDEADRWTIEPRGEFLDGRGAATDGRLLARGQLPLRGPDLPARQPAAAGASPAGAREAPAARPLGDHPGAQLHLRPPEPGDPGERPEHDLHRGTRARRPGAGGEHLAGGDLQRGVPRRPAERRGDAEAVPAILLSRGDPQPRGPRDPGLHPRGRRAGVRPLPRLRGGLRQPRPDRGVRRRRRRGGDRAARRVVALQQVPEPGDRRGGPADPAPQRVQDRQSDDPRADPPGGARQPVRRLRVRAALRRRGRPRDDAPFDGDDDGHGGRGDPFHPAGSAHRGEHGASPVADDHPPDAERMDGAENRGREADGGVLEVPPGPLRRHGGKARPPPVAGGVDEGVPAGGALRRGRPLAAGARGAAPGGKPADGGQPARQRGDPAQGPRDARLPGVRRRRFRSRGAPRRRRPA